MAPKTRGALFSGKLHLAKALTDSLVSDGFRKIIEESGLVGCTFEREVVFVGDQAGRIPQKYWVIGTNVVLPPLSRRTVWEDAEGRRVAGPEVPGASIPTGEIYRYDEASLAPLGEFDNAMMLESDPKEPAMVMSQRFYQLCRKHKIRLVLEPVGVVKN